MTLIKNLLFLKAEKSRREQWLFKWLQHV